MGEVGRVDGPVFAISIVCTVLAYPAVGTSMRTTRVGRGPEGVGVADFLAFLLLTDAATPARLRPASAMVETSPSAPVLAETPRSASLAGVLGLAVGLAGVPGLAGFSGFGVSLPGFSGFGVSGIGASGAGQSLTVYVPLSPFSAKAMTTDWPWPSASFDPILTSLPSLATEFTETRIGFLPPLRRSSTPGLPTYLQTQTCLRASWSFGAAKAEAAGTVRVAAVVLCPTGVQGWRGLLLRPSRPCSAKEVR